MLYSADWRIQSGEAEIIYNWEHLVKEKNLTYAKDFSSDFMNQIATDLLTICMKSGVTAAQKEILEKAAMVIYTIIIQHEIA